MQVRWEPELAFLPWSMPGLQVQPVCRGHHLKHAAVCVTLHPLPSPARITAQTSESPKHVLMLTRLVSSHTNRIGCLPHYTGYCFNAILLTCSNRIINVDDITLHCIALHCIALHCTALPCVALHCSTSHPICCAGCLASPVSKVWKLISQLGIFTTMTTAQEGSAGICEGRGSRWQGCPLRPSPLGSTVHVSPPDLQPMARHERVHNAWLKVDGSASSQLRSLHSLLFSF